MKLYFPTTSLNFNDIFATESISPKYYYNNRVFGTKRHFVTNLAISQYYITLFEKLPNFQLSNSDMEEYPMVLELDIDLESPNIRKIDNGIYLTNKTIYLNYYNVRILFFSETDYNNVITKSQLVNETKTVSKYKDKFEVIQAPLYPTQENLPLYSFEPSNSELKNELEFDKIYNHIKGFFYAYISSNIVLEYKKKCYELSRNTDALKKLDELRDLYSHHLTINSDLVIDLLNLSYKYAKRDLEKSKKLCNDLIYNLNIFKLDNKNHIIFDNTRVRITDEMKLFQIILNTILDSPRNKVGEITKDEIKNLITRIGSIIETYYGDNTSYKNDYNLIYERLVNRTYSIDIANIHSNVLQNLFAFVLKCNNIDEFLNFIESKNIKNSYLAFSFLGAFIGFASLNRVITHNLFTEDNEELYCHIDNILCNFRMNIKISSDQDKMKGINNNKLNLSYNDKTTENHSKENNKALYTIEIPNESLAKTTSSQDKNSDQIKIRTQIYDEIHIIKGYKRLNVFLKKTKILLPEHIEVTFEQSGYDVDIMFLDLKTDMIINILLKNKINLNENDLSSYKNYMKRLGINKPNLNGNYPVYKYNKTVGDDVQELNYEEEINLLEYLRQLKSIQ